MSDVNAIIAGSVWKIVVADGQLVSAGEVVGRCWCIEVDADRRRTGGSSG